MMYRRPRVVKPYLASLVPKARFHPKCGFPDESFFQEDVDMIIRNALFPLKGF